MIDRRLVGLLFYTLIDWSFDRMSALIDTVLARMMDVLIVWSFD